MNGCNSPLLEDVTKEILGGAPALTCPSDPASIEWIAGFNTNQVPPNTPQDPSVDPSIFGMATVASPCPTDMIEYADTLYGPTPANCPDLWVLERTWSVTNSAGLVDMCVQTFTFTDTTPPDIVCPSDPAPIEWIPNFSTTQVPPGTPQDPSVDPYTYGMATATDNCGNPLISYADTLYGPSPGDCPNLWVLERTWRATDACGLVDSCVQTFTFTDTTPPDI
ncbi:MAG: hypothetical protein AAFX78_20340, partial [Cyanobacteria bacterium J06638_20]